MRTSESLTRLEVVLPAPQTGSTHGPRLHRSQGADRARRSGRRTSCTGARKWFFGLRFTFRTSGLLGRPGGADKGVRWASRRLRELVARWRWQRGRDVLSADSAAR